MLRSASIYVFAELTRKGLGFAMLPVLTRLLSPAEFGIYGTMMTMRGFLAQLLPLGLSVAVQRQYFHFQKDLPGFQRYFTSNCLFLAASAGALCLALTFCGPWLWDFIGGDRVSFSPYVPLVIWTSFVGLSTAVVCPMLVSMERPTAASVLDVGRVALQWAIVLVVLALFQNGVLGCLIGEFSAALIFAGFAAWYSREFFVGAFSSADVKRALRFGLPLLPTMIFGWVLSISDRFFLLKFTSLDETGHYSLAASLAASVGLLIAGAQKAFFPWICTNLKSPSPDSIRKFELWTFVGMAVGCGGVVTGVALGTEMFAIIAPSSFAGASEYWPPLLVSCLVVAASAQASNFLYLEERTRVFPFIYGAGALSNVGLNALLIPKYGAVAAAYTTLASFLIVSVGFFVVSRPFKKTGIRPMRYLGLVLFSACCVILAATISGEEVWVRIGLSTTFCGAAAVLIHRSVRLDRADNETG